MMARYWSPAFRLNSCDQRGLPTLEATFISYLKDAELHDKIKTQIQSPRQ